MGFFLRTRSGLCTDLFFGKNFRISNHFVPIFICLFVYCVAAHRDASSDPKDPVARLNARFKAALGVSKLDRFGHSVGVCIIIHPLA